MNDEETLAMLEIMAEAAREADEIMRERDEAYRAAMKPLDPPPVETPPP
jgi:hypothetical protein